MNEVVLNILEKSTALEDADFLPNFLGRHMEGALAGRIPVVLFGAGSAGKELYPLFRRHGISPVCFGDNNAARAGQLHCGLPILPLSELQQSHKESLIVVTVGTGRDEVRRQLIEAGFCQERVLTLADAGALSYYTQLSQWHWSREDLLHHQDQLSKAYRSLCDQRSRDLFVSRIALFVAGADYRSYCDFISGSSDAGPGRGADFSEYAGEAFLQFNNDLIRLEEDEVVVDGGAFTGDSALEFLRACSRAGLERRKIICYEPDPMIFARLRENTAGYDGISYRPFGLWSHAATLSFADSNLLDPGSTRIVSETDSLNGDSEGITEICTVSLDEDLRDEQVTLIKMDIEGAEVEALRGAVNTITRCRPKLVISVYHKRDDIFEIPLLVQQMVPGYKLYLRHFSNSFCETTLFAIR